MNRKGRPLIKIIPRGIVHQNVNDKIENHLEVHARNIFIALVY
jgi:hypothetical protein